MNYIKYILFFLLLMPQIVSAQNIKVLVYDDPPLVFSDEKGKPQGLFIDVLNEIARKENWVLEYKYYEIKDILPAIKNREVDIIPDVITESLYDLYFGKESLLSSWGKIYFSNKLSIKNITDLNDKVIAVQEGDYVVDAKENGLLNLLNSFNINAKIIYVKTYEEVFEYIRDGKADAGVVNKLFGDFNYQNYKLEKSEIIFTPIRTVFTALSGSEKNKNYIDIIDKHIVNLKKDQKSIYFTSLNKHLAQTSHTVLPEWFYFVLLITGILIILLIGSGLFLRQQVKRRTSELSNANFELKISTNKNAEINSELLESGRKFSTLINNLKGIAFRAKNKKARTMEFISSGVFELTGFKPKKFLKSDNFTWMSVIYKEDKNRVWEEIQNKLNQNKAYEVNYRVLDNENKIKWVNEKGEAVLNDKNKIIAIEGLINDITLLKEKEIELIKHKKNLEVIVSKRTNEISTKNEELSLSNQELFLINEQLVVEIVDRKLAQERSVKLSSELQEINVQLEERQEEILQQSEVLAVTNEELELRKANLEDALRKLKRAQSKLIQSEKMATVGQLTAGIAHEINNPVNFINAGIDSLEHILIDIMEVVHLYNEINKENILAKLEEIREIKKSINYEKLLEGVEKLTKNIKTGAVRTTEIVKSLRLFSRLDENDLKIVDIHENIDSTLVILQNKYKNRIKIKKEYTKMGMLECYPGKINQVFMNLLVNAIDSIPEKGEVLIKTGVSEVLKNGKPQFTYISIKDTGVGMPESVLHNIFEPFFTTKDVGKGTGLGLSISYSIIEAHNGEIEVFSEVGKGTEFFITLPTIVEKATLKQ